MKKFRNRINNSVNKEFDEANTFSESLSEDALKDRSIKSALKNLELKKNFKMDSNIDELKKQHLKKPDDIKIIFHPQI